MRPRADLAYACRLWLTWPDGSSAGTCDAYLAETAGADHARGDTEVTSIELLAEPR